MRDEGVYAEFADAELLLAAMRALKRSDFPPVDAYSPYPIDEVADFLALPRTRILRYAGWAALVGALGAYLLQWWVNAYDYRLIVGSRPPHAPPAFVPATFETSVLFTAGVTFLGLLAACGLPRLSRPLFTVPGISSATSCGFWLRVCPLDDASTQRAVAELRRLGALRCEILGRAS